MARKNKKYINLLDNRERERLPFNWCDKWCERCEKSYRCKLFHSEQKRAMIHSAEGRDPTDPEVVLEDVHKDLEKLQTVIEKDLKKQGLNFKDIKKEINRINIELRESPEFDLTQKAEDYAQKCGLLIDVLLDKMQFNPYLDEKLKNHIEILNWYQSIIPVKIRRVLDGLWESRIDGEENETSLRDAYWTADVVSKSIILSKDALESIMVYEPGSEKTGTFLLKLLQEIEEEFIKILDIGLSRHIQKTVNRKNLIYEHPFLT